MQKKPSEWVSISDLMSGVMAVVMLMLVISVLQNTYAEIKHKQELEGGQKSQQQKVQKMMTDMKNSVSKQGADGLVDFNLDKLAGLDEAGVLAFKVFIGPVSPDYQSLNMGLIREALQITKEFDGLIGFDKKRNFKPLIKLFKVNVS